MIRRRVVALGLGTILTAAAVLAVILWPSSEEPSGWETAARFPVRIVDGDRAVAVELTDYAAVLGRVAYEGPMLTEGEENWKPVEEFRGVDLAAVVDDAVGLDEVETVTAVALDGWHKTVPRAVLDGTTEAGTVILALSIDGEDLGEWDDAPMLVFLPDDKRFSNQDMFDALGAPYAHYFGDTPSGMGLRVKGVTFLVIDYDGGALPTLADLP